MSRLDSASNFNGKISLVRTLQIRSAVCGLCRCNNEVTGGAIGESEEVQSMSPMRCDESLEVRPEVGSGTIRLWLSRLDSASKSEC